LSGKLDGISGNIRGSAAVSSSVLECDSVVALVSGNSDDGSGGICGGGDMGGIGDIGGIGGRGGISGRGGGKGDAIGDWGSISDWGGIGDWGVVSSGGSAILEARTDGVLLRLVVNCVGRRLALESRSGRVLGEIPDDLLHFTGRPLAFLVHFSL